MSDIKQSLSRHLGQDIGPITKLLTTVAELVRPEEDDEWRGEEGIAALAVCYVAEQTQEQMIGIPAWYYQTLNYATELYLAYPEREADSKGKILFVLDITPPGVDVSEDCPEERQVVHHWTEAASTGLEQARQELIRRLYWAYPGGGDRAQYIDALAAVWGCRLLRIIRRTGCCRVTNIDVRQCTVGMLRAT